MARLSQRITSIAESSTLALSARAAALRAEGEHVIGFAAGEPDFPTPAHIVEAAAEACRVPINHRYSPAAGLPELREAVAADLAQYSDIVLKPSQVLITNGAKQAVFTAFQAIIDPGDEVLVAVPYWVTYPEAISLAGGVLVPVMTAASDGYQLTVEALDAAVTPRTKALLFVSPSNPTGAVAPPETVVAIARWAADNDLWLVTDEIYHHLVYEPAVFRSVATTADPDRCLVIGGVAKSYAMTGWRVGWLGGPTDAICAAANFQSHVTSNVSNVSQRAALAALTGPQEDVETMRSAFDHRRKLIVARLNEIDGISCAHPQGAFYAFPTVSGLFGRTIAGRAIETSLDLAAVALDEVRVVFVPGEAFGMAGAARFSYALGADELEEGMTRLASLFVD